MAAGMVRMLASDFGGASRERLRLRAPLPVDAHRPVPEQVDPVDSEPGRLSLTQAEPCAEHDGPEPIGSSVVQRLHFARGRRHDNKARELRTLRRQRAHSRANTPLELVPDSAAMSIVNPLARSRVTGVAPERSLPPSKDAAVHSQYTPGSP